MSALTANLTEAYQAQSEAADTLASKTKPYQDRLKELAKSYPELSKGELEALACTEKVGREYNEAKKQFDSASESIDVLNGKLGDASLTTQEAGSTFEHFAQAQLTLFQAQLSANGETLSAVSGSLTQLGVDTEQLASLSDDQLARLAQACRPRRSTASAPPTSPRSQATSTATSTRWCGPSRTTTRSPSSTRTATLPSTRPSSWTPRATCTPGTARSLSLIHI